MNRTSSDRDYDELQRWALTGRSENQEIVWALLAVANRMDKIATLMEKRREI
jgi:hypothetical protein